MKKDFVAQWWQKDCSIVGLFNELIEDNKTANYIKIKDDTLSLIFHQSFELKVILNGGYFNTYINDKFDYAIEEQDIYDFILEIVNDTYVILEYYKKKGFFEKRYFQFIPKERFIISKVKRENVKRVFTIDNVIFEKL